MKGVLTQFCSWSIAIRRLVPCKKSGDEWGRPRFFPTMDLGDSEEKGGTLLIHRERNQEKRV